MKWERDILGKISSCLITFHSEKAKQNYLDTKKELLNQGLNFLTIEKDDQNESFSNRVLVIENL